MAGARSTGDMNVSVFLDFCRGSCGMSGWVIQLSAKWRSMRARRLMWNTVGYDKG